jgi:hypothetical protein
MSSSIKWTTRHTLAPNVRSHSKSSVFKCFGAISYSISNIMKSVVSISNSSAMN